MHPDTTRDTCSGQAFSKAEAALRDGCSDPEKLKPPKADAAICGADGGRRVDGNG